MLFLFYVVDLVFFFNQHVLQIFYLHAQLFIAAKYLLAFFFSFFNYIYLLKQLAYFGVMIHQALLCLAKLLIIISLCLYNRFLCFCLFSFNTQFPDLVFQFLHFDVVDPFVFLSNMQATLKITYFFIFSFSLTYIF